MANLKELIYANCWCKNILDNNKNNRMQIPFNKKLVEKIQEI